MKAPLKGVFWGSRRGSLFEGASHNSATEAPSSCDLQQRHGPCAKALESPYWVLVRGSNSSYHNKEAGLLTIDPYYGNLSKILDKSQAYVSSQP